MTWLGLTPAQWVEYAAFLAAAGASLITALGVLLAPRVLHAAIWLLFCLLSIAALYALLGAHVVFAIQVLVYAGAIAVMIVFAVLLLERGTGRGILAGSQHLFAGLVSAGALTAVLVPALAYTLWKHARAAAVSGPDTGPISGQAAAIGRLFLTRHLLAFELISVALLVAMIGALVLARPDRRRQEPPETADEAEGQADVSQWHPPLNVGAEEDAP
ncbi:MAG: NADH-quinone oxidoreductase subunit J [Armatimonadetes bacterium]|nr:NADH-quinone oxidoreductase subunit J [Armatimonadota bacterium]